MAGALFTGETEHECPVCGANKSLIRFEIARDVNGRDVQVLQCQRCLVLLNGRAHDLLSEQSVMELQRTDNYWSEQTSYDREIERLNGVKPIMHYLMQKVDKPWKDLNFVDFGGGRGYVGYLAADQFARSFVCEVDTRGIEQLCETLGRPANLEIVSSLDKIAAPIDVFFGWHVLEHIPRPLQFLREHRPRIRERGIIFMQCPCYRPDAIVDCHYTFFNEPSIREVFRLLAVAEIEVGFDTANGFISFVGEVR